MRDIRVLMAAVASFGAANGFVQTAMPQLGLSLGWDSRVLGQLRAATAGGYALGCLACARLARHATGKPVMLAGVAATLAAMLALMVADDALVVTAFFGALGCANGFVFPVASAWMLGFQADEIARVRILRHYNVGWTSGFATGMYVAGWICDAGAVRFPFALAAGLCAVAFALSALASRPAAAAADAQPRAAGAGTSAGNGITAGVFLAAVAANVLAVGSFRLIVVNYPEQNHLLAHPAHWMGLFTAAAVAGQLASFLGGRAYERALGLRRAYALIAAALVASLLVFAFADGLAPLVAASVLLGLTMGPAFQGAIAASTSYFSTSRAGTTFHEATVGAAQLVTLLAGFVSSSLAARGTDALDALRAPLLGMAVAVILACAAQVAIVTRTRGPRALNARNGA